MPPAARSPPQRSGNEHGPRTQGRHWTATSHHEQPREQKGAPRASSPRYANHEKDPVNESRNDSEMSARDGNEMREPGRGEHVARAARLKLPPVSRNDTCEKRLAISTLGSNS